MIHLIAAALASVLAVILVGMFDLDAWTWWERTNRRHIIEGQLSAALTAWAVWCLILGVIELLIWM